jgi:hypothetical protein
MRAAVKGDVARLCSTRTEGSLTRWGGPAACERRAEGLAFDPVYNRGTEKLMRRLDTRYRKIDPGSVKIVEGDTSIADDEASIVLDYAKAYFDGGHGVGGEVIQMRLKRQDGTYRVSSLGTAVFAH